MARGAHLINGGRGRHAALAVARRRAPRRRRSPSPSSSSDEDDGPVAPVVAPVDLSWLCHCDHFVAATFCCALTAMACVTMATQPFLFTPCGLAMTAHVVRDQRRRDLARLRRRRVERRQLWREMAAEDVPLPNRGPGKFEDYAPLLRPDPEKEYDEQFLDMLKDRFRRDFRLSVEAFLKIMQAIRPHLKNRAPMKLRVAEGLFLHFRIADEVALIALWYLATGDTYRATASQFRNNTDRAVVMRCVRLFTSVVVKKLRRTYVTRHFPNSAAKREASAAVFQRWSNFENCCFVIDGSHIQVSPPKAIHDDYFNRKGWYSIILSGVVDGVGRFIHYNVGLPGKASDVQALTESDLYQNGARYFPHPYFGMGDSAYPFLRWLQKGFPRAASADNERQRKYNALFSGTRVVVECAYGKLKGQWRCLLHGLRQRSPDQWKTIVEACCILHNITIEEMDQGFHPFSRRFTDSPNQERGDPDNVGRRATGTVATPSAAAYRSQLFQKMVPP